MSAQVVPAPHADGIGRGADIKGRRFGSLTALCVFERGESGNRWLCQCDCGRFATRLLSQLRRSVADGREPQCSACLRELRGGLWSERRDRAASVFAEMYAHYGSLYSERTDELHRADILRDCVKFIGFAPDMAHMPAEPLAVYPEVVSGSSGGQRAAYLIPIRGRDWRCAECAQHFSVGSGCLACLHVTCEPCVALELHRCAASNRVCWEEAMTRTRAKLLPTGTPLGPGIQSILQPFLDARRRRQLVSDRRDALRRAAATNSLEKADAKPERPTRTRGGFKFDWCDFQFKDGAA